MLLKYDFLIKYIQFPDAPTTQIIGTPQMDLEEGKDSLVLRCIADANPPASIVWRRAGRSEIASLQVILHYIFVTKLFRWLLKWNSWRSGGRKGGRGVVRDDYKVNATLAYPTLVGLMAIHVT